MKIKMSIPRAQNQLFEPNMIINFDYYDTKEDKKHSPSNLNGFFKMMTCPITHTPSQN